MQAIAHSVDFLHCQSLKRSTCISLKVPVKKEQFHNFLKIRLEWVCECVCYVIRWNWYCTWYFIIIYQCLKQWNQCNNFWILQYNASEHRRTKYNKPYSMKIKLPINTNEIEGIPKYKNTKTPQLCVSECTAASRLTTLTQSLTTLRPHALKPASTLNTNFELCQSPPHSHTDNKVQESGQSISRSLQRPRSEKSVHMER